MIKMPSMIIVIAAVLLSSCANNPGQKILDDCMNRFGSERDSVGYWQCNVDNFVPFFQKNDPANSAFWELYYRAQIGIWKKHELGAIPSEEAKTMSLQLQDEASQELTKRARKMTEIEALSSQAFMQRMQGLAAFKQVAN